MAERVTLCPTVQAMLEEIHTPEVAAALERERRDFADHAVSTAARAAGRIIKRSKDGTLYVILKDNG